jgi:hypothetical protein
MGGRGYEKKLNRILDNTNYFIQFMYNILMEPNFTESNKKQLRDIINRNKKVSDSFSDLENFLLN